MELKTLVKFPIYKEKIDYSKKIMFLGSCFTDNIGKKFKDLFFPVIINPFGVIYNPLSVAKSIEILLHNIKFSEKDLFKHNNLWHSFSHHSSFSGTKKEQVIEKINKTINKASSFLKNVDFLFITFGTSWVYELKENSEIVSNCHKLPSKYFNRRLLNINEIIKNSQKFLSEIREFNNNVKIFFTISPVRHLRDGAINNQISKSALILAVNELVEKNSNANYFPSYEIVMDELRDYRFYSDDMTHLNNIAVEYIWEKLFLNLIKPESYEILKKAEKLRKSLNHKIFDKSSADYWKFKESIKKQINELKRENNSIDLSAVETKLNAV